MSSSSPKKASKWGALRKGLEAGSFAIPKDPYAEDQKDDDGEEKKKDKPLPAFL